MQQAPRLEPGYGKRERSPAHIDPLHRAEVRAIARLNKSTESKVLDGILLDYFKQFSPRYGEEVKKRRSKHGRRR